MLGLGFSEILFIGLLGLLLIKPEDLPDVARSIGRFINELKRSTETIRTELHSRDFLNIKAKPAETPAPKTPAPKTEVTAHDLNVEKGEPRWARALDKDIEA